MILRPVKTGIAVRSADDEAASGIDVELRLAIHHAGRNHGVDHVLLDFGAESLGGHIVVVLDRNDNRIDPLRLTVHVFHADLALAIRAEVRKRSVLACFT